MPYIGNDLATQFQAFATQTITGDGSTGYTLDRAVANGKELLVYINNVKQEEGSGKSYTATGTTITFSAAVASTDSCYLVYLGSAIQTINPPDASVGTTQLASGAVTGAKIASTISTNHTFSGTNTFSGTTTVPAATSGWRHIKTQTGTNASSIDFLHGTSDVVFDDTYDVYEFIVHYFYTAGGHELRILPSQDGSSFTTTNTLGYVHGGYETGSGSNHWHNEMGAVGFYRSTVSAGDAENEQFGGQIRVYSPFDSAKNTVAVSQFGGLQTSSIYFISNAMGSLSAAGRTYGLRFKSETSNVYTKISLYGIKDS